MQNKRRNRPGRSVEEVILLRKLGNQTNDVNIDGSNPETWPALRQSDIFTPQPLLLIDDPAVANMISNTSNQLQRLDHINSNIFTDTTSIQDNINHLLSKYQASRSKLRPSTSSTGNQLPRLSSHMADRQPADEMLSHFKEYCISLESKVQELESKLNAANDTLKRNGLMKPNPSNDKSVTRYCDNKINEKNMSTVASLVQEGYSAHASNDKSLILRDDLKYSLNEIDLKVFSLKELFRRGNPFELRYAAATLIVATVRGYLARQRYKYYQQGMMHWKWSRCKMVVYVLDNWLANQTKYDIGIQRLQLLRNMKLLLSIFNKWSVVSKKHAPIRLKCRHEADKMFDDHRRAFIRKAFYNFRSGCVGQQSQRQAREERRLLLETIRRDLHDQREMRGGDSLLVLDEEVKRIMYRSVVTSFLQKQDHLLTHHMFYMLKANVKQAKHHAIIANQHWFKVRAGRCFYSWSDYTYQVGRELQHKRWPGPRQYIVRYNQKRLDYFVRKRLIRYAFYPLKELILRNMRGKLAFQRFATKQLKGIVAAWREIASKEHSIKKLALTVWTEYPKDMTSKPFYAWKQYISFSKVKDAENNSLALGYLRWKARQRLYVIMRTWRHQALYGRIDGLYSRQMLVKSLQEQKQHCHSLSKLMATQTMELEECRALVYTETLKKDEIQEKLRACYLECSRLRAMAHHAQQEQRRLEALVGSLSILNPKQLDHLRRLQPNFNFKERIITERIYESADAYDEEDIQTDQVAASPMSMVVKSKHDAPALDMRALTDTDVDVDSITGTIAPPADIISTELQQNPIPSSSCDHPIDSSIHTEPIPVQDKPSSYHICRDDSILLDRIKWFISNFGEATYHHGDNHHIHSSSSNHDHDTKTTQHDDKIYSFPTYNPNTTVSLTYPNTSSSPSQPVIEVKYASSSKAHNNHHRNHDEEDSTFIAAVTAATSSMMHAISSSAISSSTLLATNYLGLGSEYVASRMMIGVIDFLQHGDMMIFSEDDRLSWTKHVLHASYIDDVDHRRDAAADHNDSHVGTISDNTIIGHIVKTKLSSSLSSIELPAQLWNNDLDVASSSILANDFTWRAALMGLRSLHLQPNQYHSVSSINTQLHDDGHEHHHNNNHDVKVPNLSSSSSIVQSGNMPLRLIRLKENMTRIMQQQEHKHHNRINQQSTSF